MINTENKRKNTISKLKSLSLVASGMIRDQAEIFADNEGTDNNKYEHYYKIKEVADMLYAGKASVLRAKYNDILDKHSSKRAKNNNRLFTLKDIHKIADDIGIPNNQSSDTQVITVANLKGGTGKTTTTLNIALCLAMKDLKRYRILLLDLDPQGSITRFLLPKLKASEAISIGDLMSDEFAIKGAINSDGVNVNPKDVEETDIDHYVWDTHIPNVKTIPTITNDIFFHDNYLKALSKCESPEETEAYRKEYLSRLKNKVIDPLKDKFDFIFIDTPPNVGLLSQNAIVAATSLLVPIKPNAVDVDGFTKYFESLSNSYEEIAERVDHSGLDLINFVIANHNQASASEQLVKDTLLVEFPEYMLETSLNYNLAITGAADRFDTVFETANADMKVGANKYKEAKRNITSVTRNLEVKLLQARKLRMGEDNGCT
jgi:chromosome partitioning protein